MSEKSLFSVAGDLQGDGEAITEIPKRLDIVLETMPVSSDEEPPKFGRMKRSSDMKVITSTMEGSWDEKLYDTTTKKETEIIEAKEEKAKFGRMKPSSIPGNTFKNKEHGYETMPTAKSKESEQEEFIYKNTDEEFYKESIDESEKKTGYERLNLKASTATEDRGIRLGDASVETRERGISSNIYFIDFILRFGRKENIPMLIYLTMNVLLVSGIVMLITGGIFPFWICCISGVLLYMSSVSIALSPIGEAILRHQNGCMKIRDRKTVDRLLPVFQEVYGKARELYPNISEDIRLYICEEKSANAFATGRRTICLTEGLLELSDDEIKATLGHEFGHLVHKDTDRILVIAIGNLFVTGICMLIQGIILFYQILLTLVAGVASENLWEAIFHGFIISFFKTVLFFIINLIMRAWTGIGCLLCMKTSRECEYLADEFCARMGYGRDLCKVLEEVGDVRLHGLFANLAKSHPDGEDRIDRIIDLLEMADKKI